MKAIFSRRSIRKYTDAVVSVEQRDMLLKAAMNAPSAGNQQPWQFVVVDERAVLDGIPAIHPYSQMLKEASLAILVCGDLSKERFAGYWVQDCSAAAENLLLAAEALGLGAVWLGVYPVNERVDKFKAMFNLPETVIPLGLIAVGHPAESKPANDKFDATRVHFNKF